MSKARLPEVLVTPTSANIKTSFDIEIFFHHAISKMAAKTPIEIIVKDHKTANKYV